MIIFFTNWGGVHDDEGTYMERRGKYCKKREILKNVINLQITRKRIVVTDIDESLLTLSFWYKDMHL